MPPIPDDFGDDFGDDCGGDGVLANFDDNFNDLDELALGKSGVDLDNDLDNLTDFDDNIDIDDDLFFFFDDECDTDVDAFFTDFFLPNTTSLVKSGTALGGKGLITAFIKCSTSCSGIS